MKTRAQIQIRGIVQGVGFRPFVFALACKNSLKGQVLNNAVGVLVDVEGDASEIEKFVRELKQNPPPLSQIETIEKKTNLTAKNFHDFRILSSESNGQKFTPISADMATCPDCLVEMFDSNDRRYRYPFINCTNCGPRFTIIENVPYDRAQTTMRDFEMCAECRAEYENPSTRRFHAEPICCPACGPEIFLYSTKESDPPLNSGRETFGSRKEIITQARHLLDHGKILVVKGIGGFHLVCDATNDLAVETLRKRKYREDKPFALMADSIAVVERYCWVSAAEKELLSSKERPIVLLERRAAADISDSIAPKSKNLGFMLPYAPLHFLLLENSEKPLVMTSGNISDEPICYQDDEAAERLQSIADYHLSHNRKIHIRADDSVVRILRSEKRKIEDDEDAESAPSHPLSQIILRRSRGFAPAPIKTSFKFKKQILACGAELKNTFCLTKDNYAFLSHHIGDLENLETLKSFSGGIEHYKRLFNLNPEIVAYDLHPEYLSTKYAHEIEAEKIGVQHHHAHIASCLADNSAEGEVIGVAMDGSGFGLDGKIWGGEFFVADFAKAERIAHLEYIPLAGGAKAIREPWRLAAVYLEKTFGDEFLNLDLPFVRGINLQSWKIVKSMIQSKTNCPETSSMGRLFDAVASLLGLRNVVNYEGQAAIELEAIADQNEIKSYQFEIGESRMIKSEVVIRKAVEDLLNGCSATEVSTKFHLAIVDLIAKIAGQLRSERKLNRVALSGGVFQNEFLLKRVRRALEEDDFEVLIHRRVPCNDGGISLGQAAIANALI